MLMTPLSPKLPLTPWLAEHSQVFLTCPLPLMLAGRQEQDEGSCFLSFADSCPRQILVICRINRLPPAPCPAAATLGHFTARTVALAKGVAGGGLPGGHHHLPQFQGWEAANPISGQHPHSLLWILRLLLSCGGFFPLLATQPVPRVLAPQSIPLSWDAVCGQPLCSYPGCKSDPLPGLPTRQGLSEPSEVGQQGGVTGYVLRLPSQIAQGTLHRVMRALESNSCPEEAQGKTQGKTQGTSEYG